MNLSENLTISVPEGTSIEKGWEKLESSYYEYVYKKSRYNQSAAARNLGVSRGTLRKKLTVYFGDKYVGRNVYDN